MRFNDIRKHGHHVQPGQAAHHPGEHQAQRPRRATPRFGDVTNDDLRFKTWEPDDPARVERRRHRDARRLGLDGRVREVHRRSFYFWMVRFLRTKYDNVEIVFITHHTEAKEVDEEAFFNLGEIGRHEGLVGLPARAATSSSERYPTRGLEHLSVPLLRRRQLGRVDNQRCLELVDQLLGDLQPLRLRRDPGRRRRLDQHADVAPSSTIDDPQASSA